MSLCTRFKTKLAPFLIIPFISGALAAATWLMMNGLGFQIQMMQLATAGVFLVCGGLLTFYVVRCINRNYCAPQQPAEYA
jgi:hypothetical protein